MFKRTRFHYLSSRVALGLIPFLLFVSTLGAQQAGTIQGQVTDDTGAVIPGASVTVVNGQTNREKKVSTDQNGGYTAPGLPPGKYTIRVTSTGFAPFEKTGIEVAPGRVVSLTAPLKVAFSKQEVTVQGETVNAVTTDPTANAGALVLRGEDLQALSDDPDDLAADLQALAGPAAGPNGGQIFIDGFSGARLPPKESIREIRINSNPFSAEYDRLGFGRIEIFTKPGSDKFHGSSSFSFSDAALNSRNPYGGARAPFQQRQYGGNIGGPLSKKSSFFLDIERREIDDTAAIDATILDSALNLQHFQQSVVTPHRRLSIAPRVDYQLNQNNTLVARYNFASNANQNSGIGDFTLPSRAVNSDFNEHTVQITETAVLSPKAINETRLQFLRIDTARTGLNNEPSINVTGAFNAGGSQAGQSSNLETRWELHNVTSIAHGTHSIKFGGRVRTIHVNDISPANFAGTFTFGGAGRGVATSGPALTSIEQYRQTLLGLAQGRSMAELRAQGLGPTQFSISTGNPAASVDQVDVGVFLQDDWRLRPNFTLSAGIRYETQTNIHDWKDFAPRIGFAYAPGAKGGRNGKTVVRGGFGLFYDRLSEDLTLSTLRFDGTRQQSYVVQDPSFYLGDIPSLATLRASAPQRINTFESDLRAPYVMQSAIGVERQLPHNTTMAMTYTNSRALHLLRSRNIGAPLPGTGIRPFPQNIFEYEANGVMNQNQLITNLNSRFNRKFSIFTFYVLNSAKSNTEGANSTPANQYDFSSEYGRSARDVRHRFVLGGSLTAPWNIRFSPFVIASSGAPFNVTVGRDVNGDTVFTDRPAIATDLSRRSVIMTPYGAFDTDPLPGQAIIARNYAEGPGSFTVNLRMSKSFGFGPVRGAAATPDSSMGGEHGGRGPGGGGGERGGRGGGPGGPGGGMRMGGGGGGMFGDSGGESRRYNLTFSVSARNVLNHLNPGSPIGNLSSDRFGQSNTLAGGFGDRGTSNNRRIEFQLRFSF